MWFKHLLILVILTTAVYLPALSTPPFIFDDFSLMSSIRQAAEATDENLIPSTGHRYFRPVTMESFRLDYYLWDLNPLMMRLVNLLIHITNTLLIYSLAYRLKEHNNRGSGQTELLLASIFAVHPLTTESVNWISGRTDPLAAMFALTGTLLFVCLLQTRHYKYAWLSAMTIFIGCLAKEVAFFLYPALLLCLWLGKNQKISNDSGVWKIYTSIPYFMGLLLYLSCRFVLLQGKDKGIQKISLLQNSSTTDTIHEKASIIYESVQTFFQALGFYLKKILIPEPLNFAIDQVNEIYVYVGIFAFLIALWILFVRNMISSILLLTLATMTPAAINAMYKIAWTAYAERYMYLPLAFFLLLIFTSMKPLKFNKTTINLILVFMLVYYIPPTLERNLLWAKPLELLKVTVSASPENRALRENLIISLIAYDQLEEARYELNELSELDPDSDFVKIYPAKISLMQGKTNRARQEIEEYFRNTITPDRDAIKILNSINQKTEDQETLHRGNKT